MTSRANSPLSSAIVFSWAPRPQMNAYRAGRSSVRFVATALYSKWPSPEVKIPLRDVQGVEEAGDVRRHGEPALPLGGELLQGQPAPVPDLDGIGTAPGSQQAEHGALAEGGVHAELQRQAAAERGPQAVDHLPQERDALLGIMHVAGSILHPQDMPRLGDVGQQR